MPVVCRRVLRCLARDAIVRDEMKRRTLSPLQAFTSKPILSLLWLTDFYRRIPTRDSLSVIVIRSIFQSIDRTCLSLQIARLLPDCRQLFVGPLRLRKRLESFLIEGLSFRSKSRPAALPRKELDAQFALKIRYGFADRRLSNL